MIGTGGAVALWLTARRQRSTELTLEHQRKVAAATERDAAEQRITELYTRAVDQLGNDKAPVRLGGLHALERLAQNNPNQQQTMVDVICAYLRMPYAPPDDKAPAEDALIETHARYEQRLQELQVRLTAQRILATHLRPDAADVFWTGIDLDLTGARLHRLNLADCRVQKVQISGAEFSGDVNFSKAEFGGDVNFSRAKFSGDVNFSQAKFSGDAYFGVAEFGGTADFEYTKFGIDADFNLATFDGEAKFEGAKFGVDVASPVHRVDGDSYYRGAQFRGVKFRGLASFKRVQFRWSANFEGARAQPGVRHSWPEKWTTRDVRMAEGEEEGWMYLVRFGDRGEQQPDGEGRSGSEAGTSGT